MERLGWGRKKSVRAAERAVALRRLFIEAIQQEYVTRFVFVDETSTNLIYCRRYDRAPAGRRLDQAVPLHGGPNVTLIAVLSPDGLGTLLSVDGAVNGAVFAAYLDQVLGPTLRPGDVVVLDNLFVHKVDGLEQVVKKYGARLLYLPHIPPILTRLNWPSANVKRGCARPRPAPVTRWKKPFARRPNG